MTPMLLRIGIGTKILLVVGVVFILFTMGLTALIGATSFSNLTQVKQSELNRTSHILASQIAQMERNAIQAARRFDESEPLITEIKLLTDRGPYYADPGSYFESDFVDAGTEIENADKIYVFQAQLELIQLLLTLQQSNRFSSISFYHLSPFEVVRDAPPVLAFRLAEETISLSQFQRRGKDNTPHFYTIDTVKFQPPAPNYFDISSAYAFPPDDFYRENNFIREPNFVPGDESFEAWRDVSEPVSKIVIKAGAPLIRTWYPVRAAMAHPKTWEVTLAPVGIIQIEQALDAPAVATIAAQLGLDVAFAQDDRLLVSSLLNAAMPIEEQQISQQEDIVTINQSAFNYAEQDIFFSGVDTGLRAIVLSPVSELEGPTSVLRSQIIQLAVIMVLLAGLFIYLILLYLLNRPLGALMDGVQRISHGDLHHAVAVGSKDEVGQLGVAFNGMAEQLRDLIGSLEQRVTERTRELTMANREAEIARRKAESANQAKSEFLSHMSHELRTPLNGILGYAQILRRNGDLAPQQVNGLTIIQQSGEHLLTLINDMLDMTRIEAQKMELFPAEIELHKFLDDLANIFRFRAKQKGLQFDYELGPDLPDAIQVDERRLRQILINLLSNAIRYTEDGRIIFRALHLNVNADDQREKNPNLALTQFQPNHLLDQRSVSVRFEIRDTGVGMTGDEIHDIFTPFEQLGEPSQRDKGSGLGLTISQSLAQIMGSEIKVKSAPGMGSTFWFDLVTPIALLAYEAGAPAPRTIVGYRGRRRTILTVDDNLHNRTLITDLLDPLGFEMIEAASGEEAVAVAERRQPDLIFMDLRMAGIGGLDAIRRIRRRETHDRLVIIAASASAFEKDREESLRSGCDGFLVKPVQATLLFALLEQHLALTWIYAAESSHAADSTDLVTIKSFTTDSPEFIVPSVEELDALLNLAQQGMMRGIRERAAYLIELDPKYEPFALHLRALAQQFREKEILAFIGEFSLAPDSLAN